MWNECDQSRVGPENGAGQTYSVLVEFGAGQQAANSGRILSSSCSKGNKTLASCAAAHLVFWSSVRAVVRRAKDVVPGQGAKYGLGTSPQQAEINHLINILAQFLLRFSGRVECVWRGRRDSRNIDRGSSNVNPGPRPIHREGMEDVPVRYSY